MLSFLYMYTHISSQDDTIAVLQVQFLAHMAILTGDWEINAPKGWKN